MEVLKAKQFFKIAHNLGRIHEFFRDTNPGGKRAASSDKVTDNDKTSLPELLKPLEQDCKALGANVSRLAVADALKLFERESTYKELRDAFEDIRRTLERELKDLMLLSISPQEQALIDQGSSAFGTEFQKSFPSAVFELEEASKCLALDRDTACVFHLMRIMEVLLRAINFCLGLPDPIGSGKNWGNMLQSVKSEMDKRAKGSGWKAGDKELFAELYASIDAVRIAWRNNTMHIERRYDSDEAEHLFAVTKVFAKKLAARCDEQGQPSA